MFATKLTFSIKEEKSSVYTQAKIWTDWSRRKASKASFVGFSFLFSFFSGSLGQPSFLLSSF